MAKTKQVKKWFEARGHMVRNNHGSIFSTSGEPDLDVFLYFGNWQRFAIPIRVEVKRDATDKARPIQLAQMVHAEKHGGELFYCLGYRSASGDRRTI